MSRENPQTRGKICVCVCVCVKVCWSMFVRGTWRTVFGASECTTAQTEAQERLGGDSAGEIVFIVILHLM